jgi:tetratricopeptide (TPR) repeat protein
MLLEERLGLGTVRAYKQGVLVLALAWTGMRISTTALAAQPANACESAIDSGNAAYARFDNILALRLYSGAHAECSHNYEAAMKMTRALIDAGEDRGVPRSESLYARALLHADTLRTLYPDSVQPYFLTAMAAANIAEIKKGARRIPFARLVEQNIRMSIRKDSAFAPSYVVLGALSREVAVSSPVLKALGRLFFAWDSHLTLTDSERSLRKALSLAPKNVYAHLELAKTLVAMGRKKDAVAVLKRMRELPRMWHQDPELQRQGSVLAQQLGN